MFHAQNKNNLSRPARQAFLLAIENENLIQNCKTASSTTFTTFFSLLLLI